MTEPSDLTEAERLNHDRTFLLILIGGALTAWEIGFELGAFDTVLYRRLFAVFVMSTAALVASVANENDENRVPLLGKCVLALPLLMVLVDITIDEDQLTRALYWIVAATSPYPIYVIAKLLGGDFFGLTRRLQIIAVVTIIGIGGVGWYMGYANDHFVTCEDFERAGEYQPSNCESESESDDG
jgi:hypothetical protein